MSVVATYRVGGMTCDHCARAVTQEIGALPSVLAVAVDLAGGEVTVTSDAPLAVAAVTAAVAEAGYALADQT
jgi:copper chaperone